MSSGASTDGEDDDVFDAVLRAVAHAPPREPMRDTSAGSKWGERYVIDRKLGSGGMGTVYLATDSLLGRQVALKVLHPSEQREPEALRERLLREARLAALVEHERIARVYDVGEHDDRLFVAMEYVRGISLREWMATPRTPAEVFAVIAQIVEGLEVLHGASIVHRDLKPENVMLPDAGGMKLLDFGLAGQVAQLPEGSGDAIASNGSVSAFQGTVGYIAPEGHADARADIFSLGVIVFELVTGERPFPAVHGAALIDYISAKPPRFDGDAWTRFPPGLAVATRRMLQLDRSARFADGKDVRGALTRPTTSRTSARPLVVGIGIAALAIGADTGTTRRTPPRVTGPAPAGMALIDEGEIVVGTTPAGVLEQCREIGAKCMATPTDATDVEAQKNLLRVLGYQPPQVNVDVAPFYLDVHEVTNDEMVRLLNSLVGVLVPVRDEDTHELRHIRFQSGTGFDDKYLIDLDADYSGIELTSDMHYRARVGRGRWPVIQVSWYGAAYYCRAQGKRLPTENEWEAAARGRDDRRFPWGSASPRCHGVNIISDAYLTLPGCPDTALPVDVMSSPQDVTPQGIHDLGGNASEWVSTVFTEGGRDREGKSEDVASSHVIRGGSYYYSFPVHTSVRNKRPANTTYMSVGFRCATDI